MIGDVQNVRVGGRFGVRTLVLVVIHVFITTPAFGLAYSGCSLMSPKLSFGTPGIHPDF